MLKDRGCVVVIVLLLAIVTIVFTGLDLYTDLVWFQALGFSSVLWRQVLMRWLIFGLAWLLSAGFLFANWWVARRLAGSGNLAVPWLRPRVTRRGVVSEPTTRVVAARAANVVTLLAAVAIGLFFALPARAMWLTALQALNGVPFGIDDPILGRDLSFFVFRLPWFSFLQGWLLWLVLVALIGAALIYLGGYTAERITSQVQVVGQRLPWLRLSPASERHLLLLGAVALGFFAWGYQLNAAQLLYSSAGSAYGAGYSDVHARLPVMHLLTAIAALGALLLVASMFVRVRWLPYATLAAWLAVAFVGGSIYPGLLQRLVVVPNELTRERPYIAHTIEFTRRAFSMHDVLEADFEVSEEAVPLNVAADEATIKNIRLWDYRPLLRTYGQLQEIRTYYAFNDVDVDRYSLGDEYRQVMLAVREIARDELPATAQTWVNRHLVYTHGSGLVASPVNEVREEGLPNLWLRDIPPRALHDELALDQPDIYYGELTTEYVIARTEEQELDYPSGDQNVYTTYDGTGGVVLDSFIKRVAFALRLGSSQLLLTDSITDESQLLWRRSIGERVRTIAPFLGYDADPYPVIVGGRVVWILDAYTVTGRYPYSEPIDTTYGKINYIRNSVKVTMDAYNGTLNFYLIDPEDPVAATYAAIFRDLFRPVDEMPAELVAHWRYPESMFRIQAAKFQRFHMSDPQVFYNQEDLWAWPEEVASGERTAIEPYYVIMQLPHGTGPEFVLMLPYTPSGKQNMIAWLYARNDGEQYGEMGVYQFPKQQLVYGPMQVESRIDQDPFISQQLSLWNQRGSQVIRGNLLVIPLDQAVLYVEPIYLQAEASQLPELRRVVVAYGNRIVMEETLAQGLARVVAGAPIDVAPAEGEELPGIEPTPGVVEGEVADLVRQADAHYQAAQECLRAGDWACYGTEIDALEPILDALLLATEE
ncbi:MAG: UPF0182 family protein [Anaerolineae bacterium]|nr:UPF0182 family protein [Anaerolineae bacterium]